MLSTLLFTDIVDSTSQLARLGDAEWAALLAEHLSRAQRVISEHRGQFIGDTGDGLVARFDGPARAVRCGLALGQDASALGLGLRAGCHTGEIEITPDGVRGITVHITARICAQARSGTLLASMIVRDLTAGSGLSFEPAGEHDLKGVPDRWPLFAATDRP